MSYSDFTLKRVKEELNVNVIEDRDLFSYIQEIQISDYLLTEQNRGQNLRYPHIIAI